MRYRGQAGGTSTEYALIATLIAGVVIFGVLALGQANANTWKDSCEQVSTAPGSNCS